MAPSRWRPVPIETRCGAIRSVFPVETSFAIVREQRVLKITAKFDIDIREFAHTAYSIRFSSRRVSVVWTNPPYYPFRWILHELHTTRVGR